MLSSMTAFATFDSDQFGWQLRSVNHRVLDVTIHLPEPLRTIEPAVRSRARAALGRGKVDATLRLRQQAETTPGVAIDHAHLMRLLAAVEQLRRDAPEVGPLDPLDLLRWPGVVPQHRDATAPLAEAALSGFDMALARLVDIRAEEGASLGAILADQLTRAEAIAAELADSASAWAPTLRANLEARMAKLTERLDPARLAQEVALLAARADITEELDRIAIHCQSCRDCLAAQGPQGRRLDFLMQELQREASTLAAKAGSADAARRAVDLKVLIEQMREQAQNVE